MQGVLYLFSLLIKKEEMKMRHDQEREKKKQISRFVKTGLWLPDLSFLK